MKNATTQITAKMTEIASAHHNQYDHSKIDILTIKDMFSDLTDDEFWYGVNGINNLGLTNSFHYDSCK